ncbi:aminotransferase class IV family protein [Thalassovita sp.]|uniref:aminotransferase class IV family protein n=1 Tax=Thalassovita sp. TaxID=1979401 RepID=UPI0029DE8C11|nr:aminotransferase class IV family protein [Thalassovita sp.]
MESPLRGTGEQFRLIETFGWWPGRGVPAADLHLDRLGRSAAAFGFGFDRDALAGRIADIKGDAPLRCRLTLGRAGDAGLTVVPLPPSAAEWTAIIAPDLLDPHDPWLRHKTSNRALYDQTRAEMPAGVDEAIFFNTDGHLCEGTITTLFVTLADGRRVTPALSCGLLPGVYRQQELAAGRAKEALITRAELSRARSVTAANALRGEIRLHLMPQPG